MHEKPFRDELERRGYGACDNCAAIHPIERGENFFWQEEQQHYTCINCDEEHQEWQRQQTRVILELDDKLQVKNFDFVQSNNQAQFDDSDIKKALESMREAAKEQIKIMEAQI